MCVVTVAYKPLAVRPRDSSAVIHILIESDMSVKSKLMLCGDSTETHSGCMFHC